jgi:putative acetyltransferase
MENWIIRKNRKRDNAAVAQLIRAVFDELNIPKVGTAYADPYLDLMFEEYNKPNRFITLKIMENCRFASLPLKMKQQLFVNCRKCIFTGNGLGIGVK